MFWFCFSSFHFYCSSSIPFWCIDVNFSWIYVSFDYTLYILLTDATTYIFAKWLHCSLPESTNYCQKKIYLISSHLFDRLLRHIEHWLRRIKYPFFQYSNDKQHLSTTNKMRLNWIKLKTRRLYCQIMFLLPMASGIAPSTMMNRHTPHISVNRYLYIFFSSNVPLSWIIIIVSTTFGIQSIIQFNSLFIYLAFFLFDLFYLYSYFYGRTITMPIVRLRKSTTEHIDR